MSFTLETQGFEEAVAFLAAVNVSKQLEDAVAGTVFAGARFAAAMTPVDTAAMQRAWTAQVEGLMGRVFIDPSAINPRSGAPVTSYAPVVDERVGITDKTMVHMGRIGTHILGEVQWEAR